MKQSREQDIGVDGRLTKSPSHSKVNNKWTATFDKTTQPLLRKTIQTYPTIKPSSKQI